MTTLCAFSIIKDEIDVVERMIAASRGLVDHYYVVDTGSTDGTQEVMTDLLGDSLTLVESPWFDFGTNLTEAVRGASKHGDWLLRLDADMVVAVASGFREWLFTGATADFYRVSLSESGTTWRLPLLLRSRPDWRYVGATHEYLDVGRLRGADVSGIHIDHMADGSNRSSKFERDIALLAPGVEKGDPRSVFYTAESLRCLGRVDEAVEMFDRRANMGAWEEEGWYASYRAGVEVLWKKDPVDGAKRLVECFLARPSRAEPLAALRDWCDANRATEVPESDVLFVEPQAYTRTSDCPMVRWKR